MKKFKQVLLCFGVLLLCSIILITEVESQIELIRIAVGKFRPLKTDYKIKEIAVGNPMVADVKVIGRNEFLVNGVAPGVTSINVWDTDGVVRDSFNVQVIKSLIPVDLIQLRVQVVEVRVNDLLELGIEWVNRIQFTESVELDNYEATDINSEQYKKSTLPGIFEIGTIGRLTRITAALNALVEKGTGRIVANPTLVARSGGKAEFWVGGEVPYLVPQERGVLGVEWKKYGAFLIIQPTGDLKRESIDIDFTIEISNLDYEHAVMIEGYSIPAIATRKTTASVQIKHGETIVISGLKQLVESKGSRGIPILSDIPIFGYLFKFEETARKDTEVTVFITAEFLARIK